MKREKERSTRERERGREVTPNDKCPVSLHGNLLRFIISTTSLGQTGKIVACVQPHGSNHELSHFLHTDLYLTGDVIYYMSCIFFLVQIYVLN